ncbi:MAG: ATP-binding protein [Treponema sp.]|nr:ATP-binding protein [Treponema sp.]
MEFKRALFKTLEERIKGKRKFIQVIAGPRQTGKTTLVRQLFKEIKIFSSFHSADDTAEVGSVWIDQIWESLRLQMQIKKAKEAVLFIDEIQKISNWSECVKKNWDRDTADGCKLKLIILGSSRLLLEDGLSESLLGRFEMNYLGHWTYSEMKKAFSFTSRQYVWFGSYPGAADLVKNENRFKNYIRNSVVEPSLSRDILMTTKISKPALLRQLFEIGTQYSAFILSFNKMLGQLTDAGNTTTLARYLTLLGQAGLIAGLNKYSKKPIIEKLSIPKLQVYNTALTTSLRTESFIEAQSDPVFWGHMIESSVGAYLINQANEFPDIKLFYWREKNAEMDFVVKYGKKIFGIEVKSNTEKINAKSRQLFLTRFPGARLILIGKSGISYEEFILASLPELFAGF